LPPVKVIIIPAATRQQFLAKPQIVLDSSPSKWYSFLLDKSPLQTTQYNHTYLMNSRIQHILDDLRYWLKSPPYRLLKKSALFDADFYLQTNHDVALSKTLPLIHYITNGFIELRQPSPIFDAEYYHKQLNPDSGQPQNPLVHYLTKGWKTGMLPNPLFDPQYYANQYRDIDFTKVNPLLHFWTNNDIRCQTCSPLPYFDPDFYLSKHPDIATYSGTPVKHYLTHGFAENKRPSIWFDTGWYIDKYDISSNPVSHYFVSGYKENKSPCPLFDPEFYEKAYNIKIKTDLFAHYIDKGMELDHKPCAWFDPVFYRQTYLAKRKESISPLKHFLQQGFQDKLSPNRAIHELAQKPLISLLVPVYNVNPYQLDKCILSVMYQSYPHWELCLVDDCSTHREIRPLLEKWAGRDSRIKILFLEENGGISAATNSGAKLATGDYFGLLDNDDELSADALYSYVQKINSDGSDLLYCDEDLIGTDNKQYSIFRKPEFNSELLLCHNYVTHFLMTTRALYEKVGGCNSTFDGAQDLDLFLNLSEHAKKISHIPQLLYHWRASESSTNIDHSQKEYADEAGRKAVENALIRRGIPGNGHTTELKFFYRVRRTVNGQIPVSLVVHWPLAKRKDNIIPWLSDLLERSDYSTIQIIVMAEDQALCDLLKKFDITCHLVPKKTSTPVAYNLALEFVSDELVAFLSSDLDYCEDGWLSALVEYGQQDRTGITGGRINRSTTHIPEPTPIPDFTNTSPLYYSRYIANCSVLMNGLHCQQEVRSVSGELCLIQTKLLKKLGGFNSDDYPHLFWMHDLCYRLLEIEKTNIYTPYSIGAISDEQTMKDKADLRPLLQQEMNRFQQNWSNLLEQKDPFFNPEILTDKSLSQKQLQTWLTTSTVQIDSD